MRKKVFVFLMMLLVQVVYATSSDFDKVINESKAFAEGKKQDSYQAMQHFDPKATFDHYSANPETTNYYGGVTQSSTNAMNSNALSAMTDTESGSAVLNSITQRPQYNISPLSPDMQHSQLIQSEADNIIRGVTSAYTDCKPKQACQMDYTMRHCTQSAINQHAMCRKNLIVNVIPQQNTMQNVTVHLQGLPSMRSGMSMITMKLNLASKSVISITGKMQNFTVSPAVPSASCPLDFEFVSADNLDTASPVTIRVLEQPSCNNHFQVTLIIIRQRMTLRSFDINLNYRFPIPQAPIVQESWSPDCNYYELLKSQGICQLQKPDTCIAGSEMRVINGVPVTRSCWTMESNYACNSGGDNDCNTIPDQCEQISSECQKKVGNTCLSYSQTYRCPQQSCVNTADVICGNGKDYCLDGDCTDHSYKPSQDMGKAAVALSAVVDATKSFDTHFIFKGHARQCRDDALDFSNCCNASGWGQDMNLAHCDNEEKALGPQREKKLTIYVGRYCSEKVLGFCVEHKESYCVFDSKLARILQEQGRRNQLHINFGDAKHPNCRGLTPEELQRLDLSHVDFGQELIDEFSQKIKKPNLNEIQDTIKEHVQRQVGQS
jgi:conjugal transfer mating pair stabilization protein TraN